MLFLLIQVKKVQVYAGHKASEFLSSKLNTTILIGSVDIEFFKKIVLEDVYIEDLHHDTLFYSKQIKVDIGKLDIKNHQLYVSSIILLNSKAKLIQYLSDEDLNLQFIIDAFDTGDTSKTVNTPWDIRFGEVTLVNTDFTYRGENDTLETTGVNYFDLRVRNVNGKITNIQFEEDTIYAKIEYLSALEKSGFVLQNFSSYVNISPVGMKFNELHVKTPQSTISTDLNFTYPNYIAFNDFNNSVKFKAEFDKTEVELSDIAYFAPQLKGLYRNVILSGKVSGKVSDLKGKDMKIKLASNSEFEGDVTLTGLPEIDETLIYLNIEKLTTNYSDLKAIPIPPFASHHTLLLPSNIETLGNMMFKGTFTGLYNDFYAYGNFTSALGRLSSDLSVRHDILLDKEIYNGKLKSYNFDFGHFFGASTLGKASMDVNINGSGLTLEKIAAELTGTLNTVEFNNYTYKNIAIQGNIAKQIFKGKLNVNDENIDFDFIGDIDFTGKLPKLDFITTLNKADLAALHFLKTDKKTDLSTQLIINVTGSNIDNLIGQINFDNTIYKENNENYKVSVFDLLLETAPEGKTIKLTSDFVDAKIKGQFKVLDLQSALEKLLSKYIPSYFDAKIKDVSQQNFEYSFLFKKTDAITRLFIPSLKVSPKTFLKGSFNSFAKKFSLIGNSENLSLFDVIFKNWTIDATSSVDELTFNIASERLVITDSLGLTDFAINTHTYSDSSSIGIAWNSRTEREYKGDVKSVLNFKANKVIELKILPSLVILSDSIWKVDNDNLVTIDPGFIRIKELAFEHGSQMVALDGRVSEEKNDQLKFKLRNFNLSNLNLFTSPAGLNFKGVINGESNINDFYHDLVLTNDLDFKSFFINNNEIGNGTVASVWDNAKDALYLHGTFAKNEIPNLLFSGYYYPKKEENSIDLEFNLQAIQMQLLQPYVKEYCSVFDGFLSGNLTLKGSLKKPNLNGLLNVNAKKIRVNYLNTMYKFNHDITIENNSFGIENMVIHDIPNNNKAIISGKVYHDNFKNFQLDIDMRANKIMCLNTTEIDNSLYYGQAFVTGIVNVFGFVNNEIFIDANVKTEKTTSNDKSDKLNILSKTEFTKIYIPLGGTSEVSQSNFITFIKKDSSLKINQDYKVSLGGLVLNFDLDVTPDAEIQLIFDQKVGDVIKARGNGNLNLKIDKGEFKMYGDYIIENGDYLFTLQNIMNKKFDIKKGGNIKWSGIPYKADLNISAIYKARASIKTFFPEDSTNSSYKKRYPVDVVMNMTGDLLSPEIDFEIGLPSVDAPTRQTIMSYINNEAEENRQVFSLLILNSFVTPYQLSNNNGGGPTVANAASSNTSEILSNQLSNMLSKISNDFDIGVNYRPGDAITKDELEVALSTQLFNDKLSIEGNIGNNTNTQNPNNIVGDVNIDYKITEDGKIRVKAFNKANDNNQTNINGTYTQGVGVFYREEFNTIGELYRQYLNTMKGWKVGKKKKKEEMTSP